MGEVVLYKEDLQDIANALENWVPDHVGLRGKIQDLIDNCCEHPEVYCVYCQQRKGLSGTIKKDSEDE